MLNPTLEVRWGTATHTGRTRAENQDAVLAHPPVFVVADGMGGHQAGRDAAELVAETFAEHPWGSWATPADLAAAVAAAQQRVAELGRRLDGAPGSTLTGVGLALHGEPSWLVFNVGDSRTYLLRHQHLSQVTVDHSHRQALVEQGWTPEQARARSSRNIIIKAIGGGLRGIPRADQWLLPARTGDRLLICSDGLTSELSDQLVTAVLMAHADPTDAARELVAAAVRGGGRDNVTVIVLDAVRVVGGDHDDEEPDHTIETLTTAEDDDTVPGLERTV